MKRVTIWLGAFLLVSLGALQARSKKSYKPNHKNYRVKHHAKKSAIAAMKSKYSDIDIKFGGRIREDYFFFDKILTLRDGFDDQYSYFRNKVEAKWRISQGKKKHGSPAIQAGLKLAHYGLWQSPGNYVKTEELALKSGDLDDAVIADEHRHKHNLPLMYLEDAWGAVHLDKLFEPFKAHPITVKAGLFPYYLGRGLSLGMHGDMALLYAGWEGLNGNTRFPSMPPGILIRGKFSKNISWDFYYNRWRDSGHKPSSILSEAHANRLSGPRPYRGKGKNRDTWAGRLNVKSKSKKLGKLKMQPYVAYTRAPEQPLEFEVDAKSYLGTVGAMADYTKGNWNVNVELAAQFGNQTVFDIDRNHVVLERDEATGAVHEYFSHILFDGTTNKVPVRSADGAAGDLLDIVNEAQNRAIDRQGQKIITAGGADVHVNGKSIENSDITFGGKRFRPRYKLDYQGVMALADVAYTFNNYPFKVAAAGGYIGGDTYPYNEETNRPYKAFIAQRGYYRGRHVKPLFMFERLALARPMNVIHRKLYAENHYRDYSNLQFIGASGTWYPLSNKKKMSLDSNLVFFWVASDMKKWDKNANAAADIGRTSAGILSRKFNVKGWQSKEDASKFLGTEINLLLNYYIVKNCRLYFNGYLFFPGQLYKDLDGQPNRFTRRKDSNGTTTYHGQGSSMASGFYTGFDYKF